jgi:hypothetical protein
MLLVPSLIRRLFELVQLVKLWLWIQGRLFESVGRTVEGLLVGCCRI